MFTVLHKRHSEVDFPTENIFTAIQLQYIPPTKDAGDCAGLHLCCGPGEADGDPSVRVGHLRDGVAFVMNEKGATVATYDLDLPKTAPPMAQGDQKAA